MLFNVNLGRGTGISIFIYFTYLSCVAYLHAIVFICLYMLVY